MPHTTCPHCKQPLPKRPMGRVPHVLRCMPCGREVRGAYGAIRHGWVCLRDLGGRKIKYDDGAFRARCPDCLREGW